MPSVASDVGAALSVASSQWQQPPSTTRDSDAQPFASLLDATMSAPDPAIAPAASQPAVQQTAAPMDQSVTTAAYRDHGASNGAASAGVTPATATSFSAAANASPDAKSSATVTNVTAMASGAHTASVARQRRGATAAIMPPGTTSGANTAQAAKTTADATAETSPPQTTTSPDTVAGPGATVGGDADASTNSPQVLANGLSTLIAPTTPQAAARKSSDASGDDHSDDVDSATDAAAAAATAGQAQPVAAAIVLGDPSNATPPAANADVSATAIGDETKTRAKVAQTTSGDPAAAATQNGKDAETVKQAPPANDAPTTNNTAVSSNDTPKAGGANNTSAPQQQAQSNSTPFVQAQAGANTAADANQAPTRADALAAPASASADTSSSAQAGSGAAKTTADGLPNFGLSPATMAVSSTTATVPGTAAALPVAGLAVAIASRAQAGSNQFDIRLDPPELGRIDVRLGVDSNGQVTSHVTVDRPDTLQLLQSQQPQLERALEQAGLKTADNGLQFTLRDQSFAGQSNNGGTQSNSAQLVIPDAQLPVVQSTQSYIRWGLGNGIDIRV